MRHSQMFWAAVAVVLALPGGAKADGPREDFEDPKAPACVAVETAPCAAVAVSTVETTDLGELFRQVAMKIEELEAKVDRAVCLAEQANGAARGPISQVSAPAGAGSECSIDTGACSSGTRGAQLASKPAGGACGSLVEACGSSCASKVTVVSVGTPSACSQAACSSSPCTELACAPAACGDETETVAILGAGDPVVLTAIGEAELRLTALHARIAELEARESEILGNIEESLAVADGARQEMVSDLQNRTLQLKDMWMRQQGQVDLAALLSSVQDTLLGMNLPQVFGGLVEFSSNVDKMADMGLQPLLEEWSAQSEQAHLGAGLIDTGRQLEGVTVGMLLNGMADDVEGMPMPPEIAQGVAMAQGFGVQNFLPMLKSNLGGLSVAALVQPMAQDLEGVTPAAYFYDLADQLPGRVLPAVAVGLGDAVEGMDLAMFLRIVSEEFGAIDARTVLIGVDKLLRGEPPAVILRAMGNKLQDVDLGAALVRLGTSLEEVSVSNVAFRMSMELEGLTVAQAMDDVQAGLTAMGVPFDLPATLKHTGDYLARSNLPQRMDGFQGMIDQLAGYTEQVRKEMGLYPHGEPDFWVEDPSVRAELAAGDLLEIIDEPILEEVEIVDGPVLDGAIGAPVEARLVDEDPELRRTRLALEDLTAAGLPADHPAVVKLQARLDELLRSTTGGGQ